MARLYADLPATLAHAIHDRLTTIARTVQRATDTTPDPHTDPDPAADADPDSGQVKGSSDPRTLDQIRADVFADMLLTTTPTGHGPADHFEKITAHIQVTIPAELLNPHPHQTGSGTAGCATLAGAGPIDTPAARILAGAGHGWERLFTDPCTGTILHVDRHDPTPALRRLLRARDEHCRFPGCRQPVHRCEIDHAIPHRTGGPTCPGNLEHLCKGHHILKHHTRWQLRHLGNGILEWTSPTGRTYIDTPAPTLRFIPTDTPTDTDPVHPPPF